MKRTINTVIAIKYNVRLNLKFFSFSLYMGFNELPHFLFSVFALELNNFNPIQYNNRYNRDNMARNIMDTSIFIFEMKKRAKIRPF